MTMTRRSVLLGAAALMLTGCGFHLRGAIKWPKAYQNVYMAGYNPDDRQTFYSAVAKYFPDHVQLVQNEANADLIIQVLSEQQSSRAVSGLAVDRATEEVVTLTIVVQVKDRDGQEILPPTTLMRERDFSYQEAALLSKSTDSQRVSAALREELAAMFMRRLEAALRVQP
ncbi:LPS assembly lipoprotein LptE [Wohlfahrtiimonas sp. G9077]|uniref:LPS-assembly lipoprotein LptE n=1 Tax=Wohlfahrtiimonas sp. G9077 TaxID=1980118 RepID=UPI000B992E4B|nr:LPS assembly lipoprotein LptE [Wohlfahrtiimonas sp. G9077]OYQ73470.1 hypothetical protein B9T20_07050 [Wohlfahrtiimonas sp. G9077]